MDPEGVTLNSRGFSTPGLPKQKTGATWPLFASQSQHSRHAEVLLEGGVPVAEPALLDLVVPRLLHDRDDHLLDFTVVLLALHLLPGVLEDQVELLLID